MTLASLPCRGVTSPAVWSCLGLAVQVAPLVVTSVVAAHQQVVEVSWQAAVRLVATLAPRRAIEEAAPLAVLAPLWPPARANRCVSFSMTTRYSPTRMRLCRSRCGNFPALGLQRSMRRPQ
jgi:hypothetical protein